MIYFIGAVKSIAILSIVLILHGLVLWQVLQPIPQRPAVFPSQPLKINFIIPPPAPVVPTPKIYSSQAVPIKSIVKSTSKFNNINQKSRKKKPRKTHQKQSRKFKKLKVRQSNKNPRRVVQKQRNNAKKINRKQKHKVKTIKKSHPTKNKIAKPQRSKKSTFPKSNNANNRGNKKLSSQLTSLPLQRVTKNNERRAQKPEKVARKNISLQNQLRSKKTSGVITDPLFLNGKPPYPLISRRRGEEGKVLLKVKVNAQGRAITVQVIKSSGSKRLDGAAVKHIKKGTFVPAQRHGKPMMGWKNIQFVFQLK